MRYARSKRPACRGVAIGIVRETQPAGQGGSLWPSPNSDVEMIDSSKIERRFYFMKSGNSSRTAEYMALFRALESKRPPSSRLFSDPFAADFLRPKLKWAVSLAALPGGNKLIETIADRRIPGARTSAIARTRLIDDLLSEAVASEPCQVVILGSGFDCRAYRLPALNGLNIYEADHPLTLQRKCRRLEEKFGRLPDNVNYLSIDFNRDCLRSVLQQGGVNKATRTVFLWEGVTNYLTVAAVNSVLQYISEFPSGSRVIFTYVHSAVLDGSVEFYGAQRLLDDVANLEEPWTFGIDPSELDRYLLECGLHLLVDLGASEYRDRYFHGIKGGMQGYEFYHVAMAEVTDKG